MNNVFELPDAMFEKCQIFFAKDKLATIIHDAVEGSDEVFFKYNIDTKETTIGFSLYYLCDESLDNSPNQDDIECSRLEFIFNSTLEAEKEGDLELLFVRPNNLAQINISFDLLSDKSEYFGTIVKPLDLKPKQREYTEVFKVINEVISDYKAYDIYNVVDQSGKQLPQDHPILSSGIFVKPMKPIQ